MLDFFIWLVHIASLVSYSLLLIFFVFARKDRLVRLAILMVLCYVIWTVASLLMRFDMAPGAGVWNRVMATAMILLPWLVFYFLLRYCGLQSRFLQYMAFLGTAAGLVLNFTEQVISRVEIVLIPQIVEGRPLAAYYFEFDWAWGAVFIFVYGLVLLALTFVLGLKTLERPRLGGALAVMAGNVIIFTSLALTVIPEVSQYSVGIVAGVLHIVCIMISIFKYRALEFQFVLKKGGALFFIIVLLALGFIYLSLQLEGALRIYVVPIGIALSLCVIYSLYLKFNRSIDKMFFSTEFQQRRWLFGFSTSLANKLELDEITDVFLEAVRNVLRVWYVHLALYDKDKDEYAVCASGIQRRRQEYVLAGDNPLTAWLHKNRACLTRDIIRTLPLFKGLWDVERESIDKMDLELAVPLTSRSRLIGMLILSQKQDGSSFTLEDMDMLLSLGGATAVALDNAFSYERAKNEADTDSLTGLFNHRYFYRVLKQRILEVGEHSLSLVLLDLDMFKLYNDMYGHLEGDRALESVADILRDHVGEQGMVARYGGEEFVIVLPRCDAEQAEVLTEKIRQVVQRVFQEETGYGQGFLSISAGICTYPQGAPNGEELLKRADIALYSAKNSGKNKIIIYEMGMTQEVGFFKDVPVPEGPVVPGDPAVSEETGLSHEMLSHASTIFALTATIETKDYYTYGHSQKVAEYASALAAAIGLDDWHVKAIMEAALLHDIGKIGIPEDILKKVGRLTEEELEIMKRHVDMSVTIIKHLPSLQYVLPAVVGHHENWDGTGYPRSIRGEEIPLSARCLAIADSFDAMMSTRPYRAGCSLEQALCELRKKSGTQFDPHLVDAFIELTRSQQIDVTPLQ